MKFKIIANLSAGKGSSKKLFAKAEKALTKSGIAYDVALSRYPWHAADLAQQAVVAGYDVVVAAGGDGTVNEVLNGLLLARDAELGTARLGILPVGRGNDFSFGMGLPIRWTEAVKVLAGGYTRWIDVGRICGGLYPAGRYFGNGVGIGFDASVDFVATDMQSTGFISYLSAAIKTLAVDFQIQPLEITLDGQQFQQPTLMVSIMNGRRMGGGFLMAPDSRTDDGLFDVCIVGEVNQAKALSILTAFISGQQHRFKSVQTFRSSQVHIRALSGIIPAHADGETICTQAKELHIELLPKQIELICPAPVPERKGKPIILRRKKTKE